jgi:hypothetical protein
MLHVPGRVVRPATQAGLGCAATPVTSRFHFWTKLFRGFCFPFLGCFKWQIVLQEVGRYRFGGDTYTQVRPVLLVVLSCCCHAVDFRVVLFYSTCLVVC